MDWLVILAVIAVLIIYLSYVVTRFTHHTNTQIKKDVDHILDLYDSLLEEKSQELRKLEREIEALKLEQQEQQNNQGWDDEKESNEVIILHDGHYVDSSFFEKYNSIKNHFYDFSYHATQKMVKNLMGLPADNLVASYKELLNVFDFQIQYEMATLNKDDQLRVCSELLTSTGKLDILNDYLKQSKSFSFFGFIDYIQSYIYYHDSLITVQSNDGRSCLDDAPKNVVFEKDQAIGEGFVVHYQGKRYDFSLRD